MKAARIINNTKSLAKRQAFLYRLLSHGGVKLSSIRDDEEKENTEQEHGVDNERKSLNENLEIQLQEWLKNGGKKGQVFNGEYFDLGTTPNVLIKHGAKRTKIIMYEDIVAKVTGMKGDNAHAIPLGEIAKLPSQLKDPILLFKGSIANSFVALTEIVDIHGNDVIVAIHINKFRNRTAITKIASMYSKTNDYGDNRIIAYVTNQIKEGNLIDASIKKAPTWFTTRGLQLPKVVQTIIDANNSITEKSENVNSNERNSKITADMTDAERYEILKHKEIQNIPVVESIPAHVLDNISEISSWDDISKYLGKDKRNLIQKLIKEFGVLNKEYFNEDIELSFEFSGNNFRESYNKQGRNYIEFAKMFSVFDTIIESAVGIEIHNKEHHKPDPTLENVFVLMSAYQDSNFIVPVKLEVKRFKDKQNTLYIAISLDKIKMTEVLKQGNTVKGVTQNSRSVNISISKLFEKINPSNKSFIKYIPNGFLNKEQLKAKEEALEEDRINDEKRNASKNERNSKKTENRGVNWNDLTEGTDIGKQAEDNSDIRVHLPASKKKADKKRSSEGGDLVLGVCLTQKI